MKLHIAAFVLLLGSCAAPPPDSERQGPPVELAGRVAGAPKRCVMLNRMDALRVSENNRRTLIYGSGRTVWANYLGQCGFGYDDVLVTEPIGTDLCGGDIVRSFDRTSRIPGPSCVLNDFVPYTR
jgi:hypothetical protein